MVASKVVRMVERKVVGMVASKVGRWVVWRVGDLVCSKAENLADVKELLMVVVTVATSVY